LLARYVIPAVNGYFRSQEKSADFIVEHQKQLMAGAGAAIMAKIVEDPRAAAAMAVTMKRAQEGQKVDTAWQPGTSPLAAEGEATPAEQSNS
jgi:hypothetical protein